MTTEFFVMATEDENGDNLYLRTGGRGSGFGFMLTKFIEDANQFVSPRRIRLFLNDREEDGSLQELLSHFRHNKVKIVHIKVEVTETTVDTIEY